MTIAALVTDLMFSSRIMAEARAAGATVKSVRSLEALQAQVASSQCSMVIIDLNTDGIDVIGAIRTTRSTSPQIRIVAFASHVQADLIKAAREAGANEVMARSAFVTKLPAILAVSADQSRQQQSSNQL
jgi:DNA-binding NarL/FixJ family response regulator